MRRYDERDPKRCYEGEESNMKKRKLFTLLSILCTLALAATALTGCSSASTTEQVASASNGAPPAMASGSNAAMPAIDENATYVQVQSIDGGTIIALVGTMEQPSGQPDGNGGQATGTAPEGTPGQPSGDANAQNAPSGDQGGQGGKGGAGGQGGMMGFTVGTETITFTVADSATITKMGRAETTDALLTDIVAGDILAVTMTDNNVAESIVIVQSASDSAAQQ